MAAQGTVTMLAGMLALSLGDTHDYRVVNGVARHTGWLHPVARLYANDGVLLAVAINQPIVHAVDEPRPFTRVPDALVLVHRSLDASFPSDHATMAGAAAVGLLIACRRLGYVAAVLAALLAADRVYVGAHYPVDVLAGLAVGGVVAALAQLAAPLVSAVLTRAPRPLRPTP